MGQLVQEQCDVRAPLAVSGHITWAWDEYAFGPSQGMTPLLLFSPGNGSDAQTLLKIVTWCTWWARILDPKFAHLLSLFSKVVSSWMLSALLLGSAGGAGGASWVLCLLAWPTEQTYVQVISSFGVYHPSVVRLRCWSSGLGRWVFSWTDIPLKPGLERNQFSQSEEPIFQ